MPKTAFARPRSRWLDVHGPVHVADFGGQGQPLVLLHGLGHSHAVWLAAAPRLAAGSRVIAIDLAGFGFTPIAQRSASVFANSKLVMRVLDDMLDEPAILIGNSMGAVVSMLTAAARPEAVAGLVLVNPGLPRPYGVPLDPEVKRLFRTVFLPYAGEASIRRRWRTLGPEGLTRETLHLCCVDASRVPPELREAMAEAARAVARTPGARLAYLEAVRSLLPLLGVTKRYDEIARGVRQPVLLIHGDQDRLVPLASAHSIVRRRRDWQLRIMADAGHIPQLEAPEEFTALVQTWLSELGAEVA